MESFRKFKNYKNARQTQNVKRFSSFFLLSWLKSLYFYLNYQMLFWGWLVTVNAYLWFSSLFAKEHFKLSKKSNKHLFRELFALNSKQGLFFKFIHIPFAVLKSVFSILKNFKNERTNFKLITKLNKIFLCYEYAQRGVM